MANLFRCGGGSGAAGAKIYNLGNGTSFNIRNLLPDVDYSALTADNFIVSLSSVPQTSFASGGHGGNNISVTGTLNAFSMQKTYDNSTGIFSIPNKKLTLHGLARWQNGDRWETYYENFPQSDMVITVFLVVGEVETA